LDEQSGRRTQQVTTQVALDEAYEKGLLRRKLDDICRLFTAFPNITVECAGDSSEAAIT
jgi:hypothetical protein